MKQTQKSRKRRAPTAAVVPPPKKPQHFFARHLAIAVALAVAVIVAYAPAFRAPFIFDDELSVQRNLSIRQLWPPGPALHPPGGSLAVSGRPVVNYSLAFNYAINRALDVDQRADPFGPNKTVGYHVLNLLLHLACGLLLFAARPPHDSGRSLCRGVDVGRGPTRRGGDGAVAAPSDPNRSGELRRAAHRAARLVLLSRHAVCRRACVGCDEPPRRDWMALRCDRRVRARHGKQGGDDHRATRRHPV